MDKKLLKRARELDDEIEKCKSALKKLKRNASLSWSLSIEVDQYYSDVGKYFKTGVELKGDTAELLHKSITTFFENQINELEKKLKKL